MRSDAELVKAVLAGSREAYAELVQRHQRALLAAAGAILGEVHLTQDAVQDAFVTAYQHLPALRRPEAFGAWVLRIARTRALHIARRRKRTVLPGGRFDPPNPDRDSRIDPRTDRVLSAVMRLPKKQRHVVLLRFFAGHSLREIAEMTGDRLGTVKSQLSRATKRLREWMGETKQ